MIRTAILLGTATAILALATRSARADAPSLADAFSVESEGSLVGLAEPGLGVSFSLNDTPAETLAGRWQFSGTTPGEVVAADAATGLSVRQERRRLGDTGFLALETTLTNRGTAPLAVGRIAPADWSFRIGNGQEQFRYRPLTYRNDPWYGSTYWTGPDWTRVGKDWHHPGTHTPSIRRFTCPKDGRVKITGRVCKAHLDGDGVRVAILHGVKTVWKAELEGRDEKGLDPDLALDVRRGDVIRFVVDKRIQIFCDTTHWDPVITYADGQAFQASSSFSTSKQGEGGWFYEMEADGATASGLPKVVGFKAGLLLHEADLDCADSQAPAAPQLDGRAAPLFVVADGADQSGIAVLLTDAASWRLDSSLTRDGRLHVRLGTSNLTDAITLQPGETVRLPQVLLGAYHGSWLTGFAKIQELLAKAPEPADLSGLRSRLAASFSPIATPLSADLKPEKNDGAAVPELDFWAMIQADWKRKDQPAETAEAYADATARQLEKARTLLADLQAAHGRDRFAAQAVQLERAAALAAQPAKDLDEARLLYGRVRWLKRQIALANPLMHFGKLVFCKRVPTSYSHLVMQYYGWRARPGGGLFVLDNPGQSLACRDILDGKLSGGNVLEPRLSYDGKRIVFSYVDLAGRSFDPGQVLNDTDEGFYHIYEVNVDGTGLRQLTDGPYDDLMPTHLPDGGIAFCSTRRQGYARCFGGQFSRRWHVYTLHRMDGDGRNIRTLSFHDTNEWFPAVSHTGHIVYARWDYIDRDAVTHQNLWATRPDGTNPVALWGNATATPHCAFQAQPIPGTGKFLFTASAHHSITAGSIAIVDPTVAVDGQAAITRITPEIVFPEAEGRDIREYYGSPWPLSEKHYLVAYSPVPLVWEPGANAPAAMGLYYLDAFGNRELVYRDPQIGSENPCPLVARPAPPVLESMLAQDAPAEGEMVLTDVYEGLGDVPRGTIKSLRVVQIYPKTTHVANSPAIGMAGEENGRAILGTVPVEADGSARFYLPARKPVLFQALDEDGFAYQTMRTITYVQPGERIACIGCHENRRSAPPPKDSIALHRPPSQLDPGELGGRPFSYVEVVQPILDRHCVRCHEGEKPGGGFDLTGTADKGFTRSYRALCGDVDFWGGGTNPQNAAKALVPRFGGRNQVQVTPPGGMYGALGSRLMKLLRAGHEDVKLSRDELGRLAAWIDLNAIFFGVNLPEDQARQLRGERVPMPEIQ